jgi:hypothetical protein
MKKASLREAMQEDANASTNAVKEPTPPQRLPFRDGKILQRRGVGPAAHEIDDRCAVAVCVGVSIPSGVSGKMSVMRVWQFVTPEHGRDSRKESGSVWTALRDCMNNINEDRVGFGRWNIKW